MNLQTQTTKVLASLTEHNFDQPYIQPSENGFEIALMWDNLETDIDYGHSFGWLMYHVREGRFTAGQGKHTNLDEAWEPPDEIPQSIWEYKEKYKL